jgi:exodeoxyribonuclease V beta subunit
MSTSFHPFLAYSASAGSGKTFALSARYIALLFMGESPASILAATFTNKAAAEMRQRVVNALRGLGEEANAAFVAVVSEQTGLSREELLARQPRVLARFLRTPTIS